MGSMRSTTANLSELKTDATKQKSPLQKQWEALVDKELKQYSQCQSYLEDSDLQNVKEYFTKLIQLWKNKIPESFDKLDSDFQKSKEDFKKLFNVINHIVSLYMMAKGDGPQNEKYFPIISALSPLEPYLGKKSKEDIGTTNTMLKQSTVICKNIIANLKKHADTIKAEIVKTVPHGRKDNIIL